jgi:hypothetical protein
VRHALRHERHAAGTDAGLFAVDVDDHLALEDVRHFVGLGMAVERRRLASHHRVLEKKERAPGVFCQELPRKDAAPKERLLLAFARGPDDWSS